jgi:hypothetical protein
LDLSLLPAFSVTRTQFFWQYSLLHIDILGFQVGAQIHSYPAQLWWVALALAAGLVALAAGLSVLSSQGRHGAVLLGLAGPAAAVTSIVGTAGLPRGVGTWGALGMGVVVAAAAIAVTLSKHPDMGAPHFLTPFAALGQVAFILVAVGFLISSSSPSTVGPTNITNVTNPYQSVTTLSTASPAVTTVPAGQLVNQYSFTETENGGYQFTGTLSLGDPEKFETGISENGFVAGTACTISPGVDAVIPGQLVVTNSTSDFNAYPSAGLSWADSSIQIEANFSDGAQCESSQNFNVNATTSDAPGQGFTLNFFIVLPGFYSPDYPDGDPVSIAQDQLQLVPVNDTNTGNTINPQTLNGPGASTSGGFFIPVDAAAAAAAAAATTTFPAATTTMPAATTTMPAATTTMPAATTTMPAATTTTPAATTTTPAATTTTPAATTTTPAASFALAPVNVGAVASNPLAGQMAVLFGTYFGGINTRHFSRAYAAYSPAYRAETSLQAFATGDATSRDTDVVINSITRNANGNAVVDVDFTSHQAPSDGPVPGQTCDNWALAYHLVAAAPGSAFSYLISSTSAIGPGYVACP